MLALSETHRGRAAGRHDAADPRRVAQHRIGADMGALLLLPEAIFFGAGQSTLEARASDALRPRSVRLPLESHRPSGAARTEGPGLSSYAPNAGLAIMCTAGPA